MKKQEAWGATSTLGKFMVFMFIWGTVNSFLAYRVNDMYIFGIAIALYLGLRRLRFV